MSGISRDRAVILRSFDYSESSIIAAALTKRHGKISLLAKGARKPGSQFYGSLRTGNTAEILFYEKEQRSLQLLKEIGGIHAFDPKSGCLENICIFQAGLEVVDRAVVDAGTDGGMFDLLEEFILSLDRCVDPWTLFFALEARMLDLGGVFPAIDECSKCKKGLAGSGITINPSSGYVTCVGCGEGGISLSCRSSELLREMIEGGPGDMTETKLDREIRQEIGRVLHRLFTFHIEGYRLPNALKILKGVE
ncbi:MAG: DNA repair protein RecO [Candidatus Krumholzibacteria bacterium]|nr:DNA repair protein RecO [Candidatus Krumholzibacteria bacterium]